MPQKASVFCNFYIRVDREALVSEQALDVGSVAFKAMSTKILLKGHIILYLSVTLICFEFYVSFIHFCNLPPF
jgi:hypothetical protein